MPHPTPAQIAYGSVTVIATTFLLLLLAPTGSLPAVALIAGTALLAGTGVAMAVRARRSVAGPPGGQQGAPLNALDRPGLPRVKV